MTQREEGITNKDLEIAMNTVVFNCFKGGLDHLIKENKGRGSEAYKRIMESISYKVSKGLAKIYYNPFMMVFVGFTDSSRDQRLPTALLKNGYDKTCFKKADTRLQDQQEDSRIGRILKDVGIYAWFNKKDNLSKGDLYRLFWADKSKEFFNLLKNSKVNIDIEEDITQINFISNTTLIPNLENLKTNKVFKPNPVRATSPIILKPSFLNPLSQESLNELFRKRNFRKQALNPFINIVNETEGPVNQSTYFKDWLVSYEEIRKNYPNHVISLSLKPKNSSSGLLEMQINGTYG
jgi:hypothetical protein